MLTPEATGKKQSLVISDYTEFPWQPCHDFHWLRLGLNVTLLKIRHLQLKNLQDHCVKVDVISYSCRKELSHSGCGHKSLTKWCITFIKCFLVICTADLVLLPPLNMVYTIIGFCITWIVFQESCDLLALITSSYGSCRVSTPFSPFHPLHKRFPVDREGDV